MLSVRPGDFVFFYQMRVDEEKKERGFRGIYQIKSEPFFDTTDIDGISENSALGLSSRDKKIFGSCPKCSCNLSEKSHPDDRTKKRCVKCGAILAANILPNRILMEPVKLFYNETEGKEAVIDDNTAYIDSNYIKNNLWTVLFRKTYGAGRDRSINPILPEESHKLGFMLNDLYEELTDVCFTPYTRPDTAKEIIVPLLTHPNGELQIEAFLEAWLMQNIDKDLPVLKDYVGSHDLEYFANNMLYGIGGEKVDILTIHKDTTARTKVNVIELKKGRVDIKALKQVSDYTKWISQLIFGNDKKNNRKKVQPILIGHQFPKKFLQEAKGFPLETRPPVFLEYAVNESEQKIIFKKIDY